MRADGGHSTPETLGCDVAVIGGGAAGLTAATQLGSAGADVVLLEEATELGGQYFKRRHEAVLDRYGDYRPAGTRLISAVRAAGVRCLTGRLVWGIDDDGRTLLTADISSGANLRVAARACIVATGAYERAMPFPGWQLPGVVTPGYAMHLATCDRISFGNRVVIAGSGPFLLAAACAVLGAGGGVVAVVEMNKPYGPSLAAMSAVRFPSRLRELAGYAATLARHRVPVLQGRTVVAAVGTDRVGEVIVTPAGAGAASLRRIAVDGLAVGFGFRPATELIRLFGADCWQDDLGDVFPRLDDLGRTTVRGVYAAGEVAQIAGMRAAVASGRLAAVAVAMDLDMPQPSADTVRAAAARLEAERRLAALTARMYPVAAANYAEMPDETLVCRCEGVHAAAIRAAGALSRNDISAAKAATRAGMGLCQGRQCGAALTALITEATGRKTAALAARMPVKPVPVNALIDDGRPGALAH
jgi:D-hydroxyproline dehydrogenase subunit alpha